MALSGATRRVSRATRRVARWGLGWVIGYDPVLVSLAAGAIPPLMFAAPTPAAGSATGATA